MYKENPNPGIVEKLYEKYYNENEFKKNKHTQYYKRWIRSLNRSIGKEPEFTKTSKKGTPEWYCLGPFDFDRLASSSSYAAGAAHIYTVEQSISDPNILYAGGATCGLWKSINKGLHWEPLFDTELLINEVYSLEIDHSNSDIAYFSSNGTLYKTIDGGSTYEIIEEDFNFIKDLVMHPTNNEILFVCDESGLYKIECKSK